MFPECLITLEVNKTIKGSIFVICVAHFALFFCCRQHIVEDVLRDWLFFCGSTEYGGMGGGRHFTHATFIVDVLSCPNSLFCFVFRRQYLINLRMRSN